MHERNYVGACAKHAFHHLVPATPVLQTGLLQSTIVTLSSPAGV